MASLIAIPVQSIVTIRSTPYKRNRRGSSEIRSPLGSGTPGGEERDAVIAIILLRISTLSTIGTSYSRTDSY